MMKNLKLKDGEINRLMGYTDHESIFGQQNAKIFDNTKNSLNTEFVFADSKEFVEEKSVLQETNAKTYTHQRIGSSRQSNNFEIETPIRVRGRHIRNKRNNLPYMTLQAPVDFVITKQRRPETHTMRTKARHIQEFEDPYADGLIKIGDYINENKSGVASERAGMTVTAIGSVRDKFASKRRQTR